MYSSNYNCVLSSFLYILPIISLFLLFFLFSDVFSVMITPGWGCGRLIFLFFSSWFFGFTFFFWSCLVIILPWGSLSGWKYLLFWEGYNMDNHRWTPDTIENAPSSTADSTEANSLWPLVSRIFSQWPTMPSQVLLVSVTVYCCSFVVRAITLLCYMRMSLLSIMGRTSCCFPNSHPAIWLPNCQSAIHAVLSTKPALFLQNSSM